MAQKTITLAGKDQLINKAEKIMGDLIHLHQMAIKKGVKIDMSMQATQKELRSLINQLERMISV